jgi:hypothetical protein
MTGMALWLAVGSFSYAETSTAPLPSMDTIVQRAIAAAQTEDDNNRAFNQHYYYTSASTKEFRNGDGDLRSQEKKQEAHDPLHKPARKVAQPIAAPSSASATTNSGSASSDKKSSVHGKAFEKKDFLMNPDLLNRFDFTLQGRETINGRDALVIDFKPKSGKLPEHSLKERFINKAAGRVWLDEEDAQLVKADLHLTKRVDVLGGLVGSVYKFTCTISRERTDDGLWFTRSTGWHLEGREVIFRRTVDYHQDTSDVRRVR